MSKYQAVEDLAESKVQPARVPKCRGVKLLRCSDIKVSMCLVNLDGKLSRILVVAIWERTVAWSRTVLEVILNMVQTEVSDLCAASPGWSHIVAQAGKFNRAG